MGTLSKVWQVIKSFWGGIFSLEWIESFFNQTNKKAKTIIIIMLMLTIALCQYQYLRYVKKCQFEPYSVESGYKLDDSIKQKDTPLITDMISEIIYRDSAFMDSSMFHNIERQFEDTRTRMVIHLNMAKDMYVQYYAMIWVAIVFAIMSFMLLLTITRTGISNTNIYITIAFITSASIAVGAYSCTQVFSFSENAAGHINMFKLYYGLNNDILTYCGNKGHFVPTWKSYDVSDKADSVRIGEKAPFMHPTQFTMYIDTEIETMQKIPFSINASQIMGMKDLEKILIPKQP